MYGAILGDIIGSKFEFDRGGNSKDFALFTPDDQFTDDTVMTIAIADGLMKAGPNANEKQIQKACIEAMQNWGHRYPHAGYGGNFYKWLFGREKPKPYNSFGNGSAMRVSAAGWLYDSIDRTRQAARATAVVTHNHPEGIKGAECTAAVIYLARNGADKNTIREYVRWEFGYDLSESMEQLRARHEHNESCQDTMPKALIAFLTGESYEDVVRNAVSLGGDTDTLAAIAGSMAEGYYRIPVGLLARGFGYLPEEMMDVLSRFDTIIGRTPSQKEDPYAANQEIKKAAGVLCAAQTDTAYIRLWEILFSRMAAHGEVPMPMVDVNHTTDLLDLDTLCVGDTISLEQEMRLQYDTVTDSDGVEWLPLFTDVEELRKGETTNIQYSVPIRTLLEDGLNSQRANGVVINPFSQPLLLTKEMLQLMLGSNA